MSGSRSWSLLSTALARFIGGRGSGAGTSRLQGETTQRTPFTPPSRDAWLYTSEFLRPWRRYHKSRIPFDGFSRIAPNTAGWDRRKVEPAINRLPRLPHIRDHPWGLQRHVPFSASDGPFAGHTLLSLAFVGDRILAAETTRVLLNLLPVERRLDYHQFITLRDILVSNVTLSWVSVAYDLQYAFPAVTNFSQKNYADLFEAYIGAAWLSAVATPESTKLKELSKFFDDFYSPLVWPALSPSALQTKEYWREVVGLQDQASAPVADPSSLDLPTDSAVKGVDGGSRGLEATDTVTFAPPSATSSPLPLSDGAEQTAKQLDEPKPSTPADTPVSVVSDLSDSVASPDATPKPDQAFAAISSEDALRISRPRKHPGAPLPRGLKSAYSPRSGGRKKVLWLHPSGVRMSRRERKLVRRGEALGNTTSTGDSQEDRASTVPSGSNPAAESKELPSRLGTGRVTLLRPPTSSEPLDRSVVTVSSSASGDLAKSTIIHGAIGDSYDSETGPALDNDEHDNYSTEKSPVPAVIGESELEVLDTSTRRDILDGPVATSSAEPWSAPPKAEQSQVTPVESSNDDRPAGLQDEGPPSPNRVARRKMRWTQAEKRLQAEKRWHDSDPRTSASEVARRTVRREALQERHEAVAALHRAVATLRESNNAVLNTGWKVWQVSNIADPTTEATGTDVGPTGLDSSASEPPSDVSAALTNEEEGIDTATDSQPLSVTLEAEIPGTVPNDLPAALTPIETTSSSETSHESDIPTVQQAVITDGIVRYERVKIRPSVMKGKRRSSIANGNQASSETKCVPLDHTSEAPGAAASLIAE